MAERRRVYSSRPMTLQEAADRLPFAVLAPATPPWPGDPRATTEARYMAPLVPGHFAKLRVTYACPPARLLIVAQGDTCPDIDPTLTHGIAGAAPFVYRGREMRLAEAPQGILCLAFAGWGTHAVITTDRTCLDPESLLEFALSFGPIRPADRVTSRL